MLIDGQSWTWVLPEFNCKLDFENKSKIAINQCKGTITGIPIPTTNENFKKIPVCFGTDSWID